MTPGVTEYVPEDIRTLYEVHDHRHAAAILSSEFPTEFAELCQALGSFRVSKEQIVAPGGNESEIPKAFSKILRPLGWAEAQLKAALLIDENPIQSDSHWIDYVKGRVALDLEWNSKDQTFDRDLYALRAFFDYDKISVGVLITRSTSLNAVFKKLGVLKKYGASTTHIEKLLPRLRAGRGGGCPILIFGITPLLVMDNQ
jgi:CRISPR-associated protein Csd2